MVYASVLHSDPPSPEAPIQFAVSALSLGGHSSRPRPRSLKAEPPFMAPTNQASRHKAATRTHTQGTWQVFHCPNFLVALCFSVSGSLDVACFCGAYYHVSTLSGSVAPPLTPRVFLVCQSSYCLLFSLPPPSSPSWSSVSRAIVFFPRLLPFLSDDDKDHDDLTNDWRLLLSLSVELLSSLLALSPLFPLSGRLSAELSFCFLALSPFSPTTTTMLRTKDSSHRLQHCRAHLRSQFYIDVPFLPVNKTINWSRYSHSNNPATAGCVCVATLYPSVFSSFHRISQGGGGGVAELRPTKLSSTPR